MKRGRVYLLVTVVLAVPLLIAGCHGSAAGPGPAPGPITDAVLQAAVDTQIALNPTPSAIDSDCATELCGLLNDPPASSDEIRAALVDFTAKVNANPDQAACQLGLCLLMLARAADNIAADLGTDLFEEIANLDLQSIATLASAQGPGGLVTRYKNLFPNAPGDTDTAQVGRLNTSQFSDADVEAALRAHMLPILYNPDGGIYQRMAKFGDCGCADPLVELGDVGGSVHTLYTCDFNMFAASAAGLYATLLEDMAYNVQLNGWTPPEDPHDMDSNHDGFLDPNEYFPPQPFGTLKPNGATELGIARERYLDAIARAKTAVTSIPDDPTDLLNMLFVSLDEELGYIIVVQVDPPENSIEALVLILDHFGALLQGEQTLELEYWAEGDAHATMPFRVNFAQMYLSPVTDFRELAPRMTITRIEPTATSPATADEYGVTFDLQDFPDPTFNGVVPDTLALLVALAQADWLQLNHAGQVWGPIPVNEALGFFRFGDGTAFWLTEEDLEMFREWTDEWLGYIIVV